jgi:hypothetical protein
VNRHVVLEFDHTADAYGTRRQRLAFWINAYNTLVARGIRRLVLRESVWEVQGFFSVISCRLGDLVLSADEIEHGVLRANRPSPLAGTPPFKPSDPRLMLAVEPMDVRIHFAISCGARSCPPVRRYDADGLESQLDDATRSYLERELTVEDHVLCAPELFRWFRDDFEAFPGGLQGFLLRHLPSGAARHAVRERGVALIEYRPYDWRLSDG